MRRFVTLDVFTNQMFGGNPLAVVLEAEGLTTQQMQSVAREFNYSETTFVLPPKDAANTAELRIFTPAREVPFAGHPNIGSAVAVAREGTLFGRKIGGEIAFEEKAGLVRIALQRKDGEPVGARLTAPAGLSLGQTVDPVIVAACADLPPDAVVTKAHKPLIASVGLEFTVAELESPEALARAEVGMPQAFSKLPGPGHDLMLYAHEGEGKVAARMFAPLDGVPEDPATGSACAALMGLLAHLDARGDGEIERTIRQGVEMGRPSRIAASAVKSGGAVTAVRVGGNCAPVMDGTLAL